MNIYTFIINPKIYFFELFTVMQGFMITFFMVPLIVVLARKYNLLYRPNSRSSHANPIPALGGIAVYAGFIITFLLTSRLNPDQSYTIILVSSLVFLTGLIDDLIDIRAWQKLVIIISLSVIIVQTDGFVISDLHGFLSIHELSPVLSFILTTFLIIFIVNAINLIDGVDGLASGLGITILGIFSACFYQSGHIEYLYLTIPMILSLLAFLLFNMWGERFKIFMGDSGSLLLGFTIAISLIWFMRIDMRHIGHFFTVSPVSVFALLIIPVFDFIHVSIKRIIKGRSPFRADRHHIHHTYLKLGLTHKATSLVLISYTFVFFFTSQLLLNYMRGYLVAIIIIAIGFVVWNYPEIMLLKRKPRKYAILRHNYIQKNSGDKKEKEQLEDFTIDDFIFREFKI